MCVDVWMCGCMAQFVYNTISQIVALAIGITFGFLLSLDANQFYKLHLSPGLYILFFFISPVLPGSVFWGGEDFP